MKDDMKYTVFGLLGIGAVTVGSLLFALATGDQSGGSTFRAFVGSLGVGLLVSGIGVIVATAFAYLRKSD